MIEFKVAELKEEFERAHPKVIALTFYADYFMTRVYHFRSVIVTDVDRTQAEYDAIYQKEIAAGQFVVGDDGKKHYSGPRPHLVDLVKNIRSRAVDLRSSIYSHDQINGLLDHLNANWKRKDGKPTALYHRVGDHGDHIHLQVEA